VPNLEGAALSFVAISVAMSADTDWAEEVVVAAPRVGMLSAVGASGRGTVSGLLRMRWASSKGTRSPHVGPTCKIAEIHYTSIAEIDCMSHVSLSMSHV